MGEKCTFGVRAAVNIDMLNEIIKREIKHFRNYRIYTPNFKSVPVTTKFYAAHDYLGEDKMTPEMLKKINEYHKLVSLKTERGPQYKYPAPATENQEYGWYNKPVYFIDRNDRRFHHYRQESETTKVEIIIRKQNPKSRAKQ